MAIVSHSYPFVIGVDTHARNHVFAVTTSAGEVIASDTFPTSKAGMARALTWVRRRTVEDLEVLMVIEGIGTYGAQLARLADDAGFTVVEATGLDSKIQRTAGKDDMLDAARIATAVLPLKVSSLRRPRAAQGERAAMRVLLGAREHMTKDRTTCVNALTALLRRVDLGIDARKPLTSKQINTVATWRSRNEPLAEATARTEAIRLARRITALADELADNQANLTALVKATTAAPLLEITGIGPVTAAVFYSTWSHDGRLRSEAAYARLGGVCPIPASSGNTIRHRLNRGGDRTLNRALHTVALTRTIHDPETRNYFERRTAEGLTPKEIRRCLKRYIARRIYRTLNAATPS